MLWVCLLLSPVRMLLWKQVTFFICGEKAVYSCVPRTKRASSVSFGSYFHHVVSNSFFSWLNRYEENILLLHLGCVLSEELEVIWSNVLLTGPRPCLRRLFELSIGTLKLINISGLPAHLDIRPWDILKIHTDAMSACKLYTDSPTLRVVWVWITMSLFSFDFSSIKV